MVGGTNAKNLNMHKKSKVQERHNAQKDIREQDDSVSTDLCTAVEHWQGGKVGEVHFT